MTWKTCKKHGDDKPNAWACPDCLRELREENKRLRDALDHVARVALGSTSSSRRDAWIAARAKSALNDDSEWRNIRRPKNYFDGCEQPRNDE